MGRGSSGATDGFARSIVKDIVYHGTNVDRIKQFNSDGKESNGAIFFSKYEDYAEEEATIKQESYGGIRTIYGVRLNIRNPLYVNLESSRFADPTLERRYIQQAKSSGYDSVIFQRIGDPYMDDTFYAVFSPSQIKIVNKRRA